MNRLIRQLEINLQDLEKKMFSMFNKYFYCFFVSIIACDWI